MERTLIQSAKARHGFTKNLLDKSNRSLLDDNGNMRNPPGDPSFVYATGNSKVMKAFIDGPYGRELDLSQYGTVLLFATDIGIAAQLPYLKQLIAERREWDSKTRRIALFWEIGAEKHVFWVTYLMNEVLDDDSDYLTPPVTHRANKSFQDLRHSCVCARRLLISRYLQRPHRIWVYALTSSDQL